MSEGRTVDGKDVVEWLNANHCLPISEAKFEQAQAVMRRIVAEMGGCHEGKCNGHSIIFGQDDLAAARQWLGIWDSAPPTAL